MNMTSETGRNQILAKWQEAFTRLNGNQPGIAGLMNFTKVRVVFLRCLGTIDIATCACAEVNLRCSGVEIRQGVPVPHRYQQSEP